MKIIGEFNIIEYQYESKEDLELHEKIMLDNGWQRVAISHFEIPYYRSYSKRTK